MNKFYLTFGQRYRHERHPSGYNVHPDGYTLIEAVDYDTAQALAVASYGRHWAALYHEDVFVPNYLQYFKKGQTHHIVQPQPIES